MADTINEAGESQQEQPIPPLFILVNGCLEGIIEQFREKPNMRGYGTRASLPVNLPATEDREEIKGRLVASLSVEYIPDSMVN